MFEVKRLVYLQEVQDPGNLGSIARSARAFRFDGLVLEGGVSPLNTKAMRSSAGALLHLPWFRGPDCSLGTLARTGFELVATVVRGGEFGGPVPDKLALVLGNEGQGLDQRALELCRRRWTLPMESGESLNVGVCAGILMFWIFNS